MAPNLKFPTNILALDQLLNHELEEGQETDVVGGACIDSEAFPPLTDELNEDDNGSTDDFFMKDIPEENKEHQQQEGAVVDEEEGNHDPSKQRRKLIKHLSSMVNDPGELDVDDERLANATREAGEYSCGVDAVEVWVLEDEKLIRPKGGWWCRHSYRNSLDLEEERGEDSSPANDAIRYLEEYPVDPMQPGVDVAGILWSESKSHHSFFKSTSRDHSFFKSVSRESVEDESKPAFSGTKIPTHPSTESLDSLSHIETSLQHARKTFHRHFYSDHHTVLTWRDLSSILQDPDSAKTIRIKYLLQAGLVKAASRPFQIDGNRAGIVIYYAGDAADSTSSNNQILTSIANETYLNRAAIMIGSAYAMSEARRASIAMKRKSGYPRNGSISTILEENTNMNDTKLEQESKKNEKTISAEEEDDKKDSKNVGQHLTHQHHGFFATWNRKCRGGNLQPPPPMSAKQTLWTIFGSFCGLLILSSLNEYYKILSNDDYFLLIGPFGALMTLQYGLTAAPASQPRNAILGQVVAGAVSLAFTYIPDEIISQWLRRAIGPAFGIGCMVKLGLTHPPAGAHAVLYASGNYNFTFYALVVLSTAISVIPATLINNMSTKRQYPTYWGVEPLKDALLCFCSY